VSLVLLTSDDAIFADLPTHLRGSGFFPGNYEIQVYPGPW